eukprot:Seg1412.5 transcript_id=Seg1412.5/GoldUCD/mRNA.D3Y31 product="hypothetical protein" protein_id=Seg1412.5/GoldUCD/D3Y31
MSTPTKPLATEARAKAHAKYFVGKLREGTQKRKSTSKGANNAAILMLRKKSAALKAKRGSNQNLSTGSLQSRKSSTDRLSVASTRSSIDNGFAYVKYSFGNRSAANAKWKDTLCKLRDIMNKTPESTNEESDIQTESAAESMHSITNSMDAESNEMREARKQRERSLVRGAQGRRRATDHSTHLRAKLNDQEIVIETCMKDATVKRKLNETRDELDSIMDRITITINNYMEESDINEKSESESERLSQEISIHSVQDMDMERERQKRDARQKLIDTFKSSLKKADDRVELIQDVKNWFSNVHQSEVEDDENKMAERAAEASKIHRSIVASMSKVKSTSTKLRAIAKQLMSVGMSSEGDDQSGPKNENDSNRQWLTAQDLGDQKNWQLASRKILVDLEEATRTMRQATIRKVLQNTTKQFKVLSSVIDHKAKEFHNVESELSDKGKALQKALHDGKKLQERLQEDAMQIMKLDETNNSLTMKVEMLQKKINEGMITEKQQNSKRQKVKPEKSPHLKPKADDAAKGNTTVTEATKTTKEKEQEEENVDHQAKSRPRLTEPEDLIPAIQERSVMGKKPDRKPDREPDGLSVGLSVERPSSSKSLGHSFTSITKDRDAAGRPPSSRGTQTLGRSLKSNTTEGDAGFDILSMLKLRDKETADNKDTVIGNSPEEIIELLKEQLAYSKNELQHQALKIIELDAEVGETEQLENHIKELTADKREVEEQLNKSVAAYEEDLEKRQQTIGTLTDSINEVKHNLVMKEDETAHIKRLFDTLTAEMQVLMNEKMTLEQQHQQQRDKEKAEHLLKQKMLTKMMERHDLQLRKLRLFLAEEQQRFLAETRSLKMQHQRDFYTIHKGCMQLVRMVNKFKESIAAILDRESLTEGAFEIRQIESIPINPAFSSSAETKALLPVAAFQTTKLLILIENKLSKALLSKRLEMKEVSAAKEFATKDLSNQTEKLRKVNETAAVQAEKLKQLDDTNKEIANDYKELLCNHKDLQKQLAPYQLLIECHMQLKKEFQRIQVENKEAAKEKENQLIEMEKDRTQLRRELQTQQEQRAKSANPEERAIREETRMRFNKVLEQKQAHKTASMFHIVKAAQEKNLLRVDQAFASDQISSEMQEKATKLINRTLNLPRIRFRHLVERYVAHKKMQFMIEVFKVALVKYKNNIRLTNYVRGMNIRFQDKKSRWDERKAELEHHRATTLLDLMAMFARVRNETGLLLMEPINIGPDGQSYKSKQRAKFIMKPGKYELTQLNDSVVGTAISLGRQAEESCTMWRQPDLENAVHPPLIIPRIVDLDINRWKHTAKSTLVADVNELSKQELSRNLKMRMEKIKMAYSSKLTLPPIASIYPEQPTRLKYVLEDDINYKTKK